MFKLSLLNRKLANIMLAMYANIMLLLLWWWWYNPHMIHFLL